MSELKKLNINAIPKALERAMRYRLLNEPFQTESICRDILAVDADNQDARVILVLAMTDQFGQEKSPSLATVEDELRHLTDNYKQTYYTGIAFERRAIASIRSNRILDTGNAYDVLQKAMEYYQKAEDIQPENNNDAIVRWNACIRLIDRHNLKPAPEEDKFQPYGD